LAASIQNLIGAYLMAIVRLRRKVLRVPAHSIFVGHVSLFWLGLAHQRRWNSHVIINGRERPGGVRTKGSLATWFSRIEPFVLRRVARKRPTLLAVCESHAEDFRALGFDDVRVVRNVPSASFAPEFVAPPDGEELIVCCVGSLYPGRGVETLIDAVVSARQSGAAVRLDITGPASAEYARSLQHRIDAAGASAYVRMHGPCRPDEVAARYQAAHVGTALYEASDSANDSLSNKIFEGIVAGRPVIAGDLPENKRIITSHDVGWAVSVDTKALSALLGDLALDLEGVRARALRCFEVGRQHFTWEAEIDDVRLHVERRAEILD
jgi:glycosyltransferase involved in cell wall biosynthesis